MLIWKSNNKNLYLFAKNYVDGYGLLLYNVTVDVVRRLASISPEAGFTITFLAGARTSPAWELF